MAVVWVPPQQIHNFLWICRVDEQIFDFHTGCFLVESPQDLFKQHLLKRLHQALHRWQFRYPPRGWFHTWSFEMTISKIDHYAPDCVTHTWGRCNFCRHPSNSYGCWLLPSLWYSLLRSGRRDWTVCEVVESVGCLLWQRSVKVRKELATGLYLSIIPSIADRLLLRLCGCWLCFSTTK